MDTATEGRPARALTASLAGLQAGMIAVLGMLAWMGVSAVWKRLSFWTAENLLATFFYGDAALAPGFSTRTVSGLALFLMLYSLLGAFFAVVMRRRLPPARLALAGIFFGLCWYYVSYRMIWRSVMPLVALLHPEQPTLIGHALYGAVLSLFPHYLETSVRRAAQEEPPPPEAPAAEPAVPEIGPDAPEA